MCISMSIPSVREVFARVRAAGRVELGEIEAREVIEAAHAPAEIAAGALAR